MRLASVALLGLVLAGMVVGAGPVSGAGQVVVTPHENVVPGQVHIWMDPVVVISPGTTVTWRNTGVLVHTVVSTVGSAIPQGRIEPGQEYSVTFSAAGVFPYHCVQHQNSGMHGVIIVTT